MAESGERERLLLLSSFLLLILERVRAKKMKLTETDVDDGAETKKLLTLLLKISFRFLCFSRAPLARTPPLPRAARSRIASCDRKERMSQSKDQVNFDSEDGKKTSPASFSLLRRPPRLSLSLACSFNDLARFLRLVAFYGALSFASSLP